VKENGVIILQTSLAHAKSAQVENKQLIQDLDGQQKGTTQQVKKMGLEILYIRDKQGDDTNRINEFADEISEIKEDIEEIKQTTSRERPRGKVSTNIASFEIEFCKVSFDSADIQKTPPGYIS
jgi:chromosome segregation ATPase